MDLQASIILVIVLLVGAFSYDDVTLNDLDDDTRAEFKYMLENYIDFTANCNQPRTPAADFLLYNRDNSDQPITLDATNPTQIDPSKKTFVILHGWLARASSSLTQKLKQAYLTRYDANVILVDWSSLAWKPYTSSYCEAPGVANLVAKFLCVLAKQLGIDLGEIHVIGNSMGGQIAGLAGQYVQLQCQQTLGRITGLDPSGPIYKSLGERLRLDKTDAQFVDVIHTDEMKFGIQINCGHVDFHPNCGYEQPGCPYRGVVTNDTKISDGLCNSLRSMELMEESVSSNDLIAVSCSLCSRYCHPDIISEVYAVMGEECRKIPSPAKNFMISTRSSSPYGEGWDAYPNRVGQSYSNKMKRIGDYLKNLTD